MDSRDRDAISDLFRKLKDVEHQAGPRDAEAERLIADEAQRLPGAPYYMAQTIVMQDMALNAKQRELDELKQRLEQDAAGRERPGETGGGGGFLSRMFGGGGNEQMADRSSSAGRGGPWNGGAAAAPQGYSQQPQPYGQPPQYPPQQSGFGRGFGGGGFLAGAAQTAMGVAGGVVLGNAIGSMFGGHGGLFGGGTEQPQEVVNETTNVYEGDGSADRQDASDQGGYADDNSGYQDASYDDGGGMDDFGDTDDI